MLSAFRASACVLGGLLVATRVGGDSISERARKLHFSAIVVDTHDDTTQRLLDERFDLADRHADGSIDIPRMKAGGLDAIFFSIWMSGKITGPEAVKRAEAQIAAVREQVRKHPKDLVLATTSNEVRAAKREGQIAVLMGDQAAHNGLTDFGKEVVREMNRLGVIVDISHVSDKTFYDVLLTSKAPVFASHSSCRAICDAPRNMTDQMIKDLAAKGGVIQINYHVGFLGQEFRDAEKAKPEME